MRRRLLRKPAPEKTSHSAPSTSHEIYVFNISWLYIFSKILRFDAFFVFLRPFYIMVNKFLQ